ncbi:hypothetical protein TNCV_3094151 [Trichonephila clavipes]|nr:hypothetical protein TNCV_3094151 [Trichonephila clavipes]
MLAPPGLLRLLRMRDLQFEKCCSMSLECFYFQHASPYVWITPPPGCHYAHLERNDPHPDIPSSLTTPVVCNDPGVPSTSTPRNACVVNEPCPYLLQPQDLPHAIVCSGPLDGQAYTSTVREERKELALNANGFSVSQRVRNQGI